MVIRRDIPVKILRYMHLSDRDKGIDILAVINKEYYGILM
jgi:hypothetical protein